MAGTRPVSTIGGAFLRQINPSGKSSLFPKGKSPVGVRHPVPLERGRWPSLPNVGTGVAVDATASCARGIAGRDQLREWFLLERADERCRSDTAKACGSDAPVLGVKSRGGAKAQPARRASFRGGRRGQEGPIPRGERVISRRPLRRDAGCSPLPCMLECAFFYPLHMRPRVQRASGIPCSLIFRSGQRLCKTSGRSCRENADMHLPFEI